MHGYVYISLPVFQMTVRFIAHRDTGVWLPHINELLVSLRGLFTMLFNWLKLMFTKSKTCLSVIFFLPLKRISEVEHS